MKVSLDDKNALRLAFASASEALKNFDDVQCHLKNWYDASYGEITLVKSIEDKLNSAVNDLRTLNRGTTIINS